MGGLLIVSAGAAGSLLFGFCLFLNASLVMCWLFLELSGLCLIPLFFSDVAFVGLSGLFYYIVFSGVSSAMLLLGILLSDCFFFFIGGVVLKFGVFPLWGWVYYVCSYSNWFVVWGVSTVLKIPFFLVPLFLVPSYFLLQGLLIICSLGCLLISSFFWFCAYDWKICWCHIMLSSSSVLVGLGLSGCQLGSLSWVFTIYFLWASLAIFFLSSLRFEWFYNGFLSCIYCIVLLVFPVSIPIFYKFLVCSCVFSSGFLLLASWVVYSFSEQLYLFLLLTGLYDGKYTGGSLALA